MYYTRKQTNRHPITIRLARSEDEDALRRLAQLDSAGVPSGELLVALTGDEIRAAISITSGEAIADPFRRNAELVRLLAARAEQVRGPREPTLRRRLGRAMRGSGRRSSVAPQPAGTLRVVD
jgi:hypothetical protein